jgi:ParB/RepB/Spo0J family partition protein
MNREVIQYLTPESLELRSQIRGQFVERDTVGLARSIQEMGMQQPVRVRRDGETLVVVVGERRVRAARLAKLAEIPVIIEEKPLCEGDVLHRQLVENIQRIELLPMERARGLERLIEATGWTIKDAAAKCGLSSSTATKLLSLLSLPADIQQRIDCGEIPWSSGYELSRVSDASRQGELATRVAEGEATRDFVAIEGGWPHSNGEGSNRACKRIQFVMQTGQTISVTGSDLTVEDVVAAAEEMLRQTRRAARRGLDIKGLAAELRRAART